MDPRVKFPTLILEHHNDSLMLLYVIYFCSFSVSFVVSTNVVVINCEAKIVQAERESTSNPQEKSTYLISARMSAGKSTFDASPFGLFFRKSIGTIVCCTDKKPNDKE